MKTTGTSVRYGTKTQKLRKPARIKSGFTSVHLLILAFIFVMAFGAVMKMVNG